jgi:hypothetical protein
MSYIYLQEQGAESSAECFSDIPQFVLSRLNRTAETSCSNDSETGACLDSRFGTTCEPSTGGHGAVKSMSCAVDSHVPTSALQDGSGNTSLETSREIAVVYGGKWRESSVKYDRDTSSWKTHRLLWVEDLPWSSVTLPKWGMMHDGVCWGQTSPDYLTIEPVCGWLPTPCASQYRGTSRHRYKGSPEYRGTNLVEGLRTCETDPQRASISIAARVMGWPTTWTSGQPLAMDKFQQWLRLHGKSSQVNDD